jgi:Ca2+/Na+ antiporter
LHSPLVKKSNFYSRVRLGRQVWLERYFVLDDHPTHPFRYHRIADDGSVKRERLVKIDLAKVRNIEFVANLEIHLISAERKHKIRCAPDAPTNLMQMWFDELVCKIDEARGTLPIATADGEAADDEDEHHEPWYKLPDSGPGIVMALLVFPLKLLIHLTVPSMHSPSGKKWYLATLILSTVWLAALAYVMTLMLNKIGCAVGISSMVMGLTAGAVGTSFPNMYASILTAKAGQGDQAICQAFGSNTFNVLICLGAVWLFEGIAGMCKYGGYAGIGVHFAWCAGCYMPVNLEPLCPHVLGAPAQYKSGTLEGTALVIYFCIAAFCVALIAGKGVINRVAGSAFFVIYLVYVIYEVLGAYDTIPPVCIAGVCL